MSDTQGISVESGLAHMKFCRLVKVKENQKALNLGVVGSARKGGPYEILQGVRPNTGIIVLRNLITTLEESMFSVTNHCDGLHPVQFLDRFGPDK